MDMHSTKNLYIIDSAVIDYGALVADLPEGSEWFILDSDQDGLLQLQEILANYSQLDSIQILSHGSPGVLYLGSTALTEITLDHYDLALAQIRESLAEDADILLYGCEVAAGETGRNFIGKLGKCCGANVAANENLTGARELGGSWSLNETTGAIKANVFASGSYQYVLVTPSYYNGTYTGTSGGDYYTGSSANETLIGADGNDNLNGSGGNDRISGDAGNDTLSGGAGNDALVGGLGDDSLTGGEGIDRFQVDGGIDTITDLGLGGAEVLQVWGDATVYATIGAAWGATVASYNQGWLSRVFITTNGFGVDLGAITSGGCGFSITNVGVGTTLVGSTLADTLIGGDGDDHLGGHYGSDNITGGGGNDYLWGSSQIGENDTLTGGEGVDYFITGNDGTTNTITDLGRGGAAYSLHTFALLMRPFGRHGRQRQIRITNSGQ